MLVVAGAGSGKTRVLTHRIAHLVTACGVKPNEILAITFTNKAAGEMKRRLELGLGDVAQRMWVMTFHAACGRILRREAPRLNYRSNFTIYDQADQVRVVKAIVEEEGWDPKRFVPRGIHAQISNAKNQLVGPEEYARRVGSFYEQTVAAVYKRYQSRLLTSNAMDFDDLIMRTVEVLENHPDAREKWQKAFRYVLVDEYQDTNHAQYRLLQLLAGVHGNVFAVGDPDQSIYAFRGADIRNILEFERDFGGAQVIALEQNYRSTNAILRAANSLIAQEPRAQAEEPVQRARRGRPGPRARGRGRARRGALRRLRDRRPDRGGPRRRRDRGLLPHERAVARAGGRARPPGDPVPGDRRPALLRARRDQGRGRLPPGHRQPLRRRLARAHRQPAAPRHRRRVDRPPPGVRRRAGHLPLRGARPGGGGRRRRRAAQGRPAPAPAPPVAPGRRARAARAGARGASPGAERLPGGAEGRAHDRGAGPHREPARARRRRARVPGGRRQPDASPSSCSRSRSSPTRTHWPRRAAASR